MTINVTRSSMPPFEEYCEEIRELWDSHWLTNMGSKHQQLERELKQFLGCEDHHDAVHLCFHNPRHRALRLYAGVL